MTSENGRTQSLLNSTGIQADCRDSKNLKILFMHQTDSVQQIGGQIVAGMAQWLKHRSIAGGLSLIYA